MKKFNTTARVSYARTSVGVDLWSNFALQGETMQERTIPDAT